MATSFISPFPARKLNHLQSLASSRQLICPKTTRRRKYFFSISTIPRCCEKSSSANNDNTNEEPSKPGEDVAKRIERTFVEACLPGTKPYVEALGEFVRSALEAYRGGYNLTALQFELQARKDHYSRNLKQEEVELRSVWLTLVYKTLREVKFPSGQALTGSGGSGHGHDSHDRLDDFVKNIVDAVKEGYDMKRIQLEQSLIEHDQKPKSPLELAILNQSLRLVLLTLSIANAMGGNGPAPRMPEST